MGAQYMFDIKIVDALCAKGDAEEDPNRAIEFYKQALDHLPDHRSSIYPTYGLILTIGDCYKDLGQYQKALEYYLRALNFQPKENGMVEFGLGALYLDHLGDHEEAKEYFQRAWDETGGYAFKDEDPRYLKFLKTGKVQPLSTKPKPPLIEGEELPDKLYAKILKLSDAGEREADKGHFKKARDRFQKALDLLPQPQGKWDAYTWLQVAIGDMSLSVGEFEDAENRFQSAFQGPEGLENPYIRLRLGDLTLRRGDEESALEFLLMAYTLAGRDVFMEDPELLEFLSSRVEL